MPGDGPPPIFALALVGTDPAVVTQLLWRLVACENAAVAGLELWCTAESVRRLRREAPGLFDRLSRALGSAAGRLPQWKPDFVVSDGTTDPPETGITVVVPRGPDGEIEDVTNELHARAFGAAIEARLRRRRGSCGALRLVGSVTGGRKPMSTALHTAFMLQARETDRLVDVQLEPAVEQALANDASLGTFACPERPIGGIPLEQQVRLCVVPFVPIADIADQASRALPASSWHATIRRAWAEGSGDWLGDRVVRLRRQGKDVYMELGRFHMRMGRQAVAYYAALVASGKWTRPQDIQAATVRVATSGRWARGINSDRTLKGLVQAFEGGTFGWTISAVAASLIPRRRGPPLKWCVCADPSVDLSNVTLDAIAQLFP